MDYRSLEIRLQGPNEEDFEERKLNSNQWICYISFEFLYEGYCDPYSVNEPGEWERGGWYGGFLLERQGMVYRMLIYRGTEDVEMKDGMSLFDNAVWNNI